jgi:hypothetical protein
MKWKLEARFRGRKWIVGYRWFIVESNHGTMLQDMTWLKILHMKIIGMKFKDWILKLFANYTYIFTKESNQGSMLQNNPTK